MMSAQGSDQGAPAASAAWMMTYARTLRTAPTAAATATIRRTRHEKAGRGKRRPKTRTREAGMALTMAFAFTGNQASERWTSEAYAMVLTRKTHARIERVQRWA